MSEPTVTTPTRTPSLDDALWNQSVTDEADAIRARLAERTDDRPATLVRDLGQGWSIHRTS